MLKNRRPRYITDQIVTDLKKKMVFLSGPRQVGKTTLAKEILTRSTSAKSLTGYFNWDDDEQRTMILKRSLKRGGLIVFDEIHKYTRWRNYLKGLFDTDGEETQILVTGSARLDLYRRGGDSLQGRYFFLRLLPYSVAELNINTQSDLDHLITLGGFPEPFFSGSLKERNRWALSYRTRLFKEDVASLENVKDLGAMELLSTRLPELVGSPLSYNSLREDLQVSHNSIVRWCDILERLYYIFRVPPFGSPKLRAVKKEVKHYHFDWSLIDSQGARFENFIAVHLYKWCAFLEDTTGREVELRYFRDSDQREVDFVITEKRAPILLIEVKLGTRSISPHLRYLKAKYPKARAVQITEQNGVHKFDDNGIELISAIKFLSELV